MSGRRWYRLGAAVVIIVLALSFQSLQVRAENQTYVVQPGETLFRIALRYGLTVNALAAANGIADPTRIRAGQVLVIPDTSTTTSAPAAAANGNPPAADQANAVPPANAAPVYYTVQAGETLNMIAQKFGLDWQTVANANGITDPNRIVVGQQILIPSGPANSSIAPAAPTTQPAAPANVQPAAPVAPVEPANVAPAPTTQPAAPAPVTTTDTSGTKTYIVQPGEGLAAIGRKFGISWPTIAGANNISDPNTIYAGMVLKIPDSDINPTTMATSNGVPPGPNPPTSAGKYIMVSLHEQRVFVYENGNLIRNVLVSTGLPGTPTVQGDYKIYVKYTAQLMTGPGYYLPGVPWVMYFYEGYSFHGTYWHHNWGHPMSHGCVNMPTDEALWLYNWAEVGTPVHVQW